MTSFIAAVILSEFALADKLVYDPGLGRCERIEGLGGPTVVILISKAKVDIVQSFTAGVL
jgi:hypothetical protein